MDARKWIAFVLSGLLVQPLLLDRAKSAAGESIDTQFIFGFTSGADVGELGDKEIEHQTIAQFGKQRRLLCGGDGRIEIRDEPDRELSIRVRTCLVIL